MTKTLRRALIACLATLCLLAALLGGGMMFMRASAAGEDVPAATTVPENELEQLSIENGVISRITTASGTSTVRFTPASESGDDYTLTDATDLAFRFKVVYRQANRPNDSSGLCYVRIKFAGNDTVWGASKEDLRFTFVNALTDEVGTVRISNGGNNNIGGQLNVPVGTDGTVYIPLTQIRDGNQTSALGNRLTEMQNWSDLAIEYIEFTYSASRWDFAFGDIALIRRTNDAITTDVLDLTAAATNNATLYDAWYDNVTLKVNGTEATLADDGIYTVDLGEMGKVYFDSDKVFAYDPIRVHSELAEGYGITGVATSAEGKTIDQRGAEADNLEIRSGNNYVYHKNGSALLTGYAYEGEYFLRRGNHCKGAESPDDDTVELGTEPLNATIEVTVSPLVALDITGEADGVDIYYFRYDSLTDWNFITHADVDDWSNMIDDGSDGKLWLAPNDESTVVVVPKAGYDFTGLKLEGETENLSIAEQQADDTTGSLEIALYKISVGETKQLEVLGLGEEVTLAAEVGEHGSVTVDSVAAEGTFTSNIYKTLTIEATPDKGYEAAVSVVYAAQEPDGEERVVPLTVASDGNYYYQVDGAFTIRAEFSVVTYALTYRLNNGEYASGESNPATITYFDTVTLKNPVREGYDFMGWRIEGEEGTVTELKEVESDLTLIAVFEMADTPVDPDPGDDPGDDPGGDNGGDNGGGCGGALAGALGLGVAAAVIMIATVAVILKKKKN